MIRFSEDVLHGNENGCEKCCAKSKICGNAYSARMRIEYSGKWCLSAEYPEKKCLECLEKVQPTKQNV